jgi:predicted phage terminase large subunit-like protein
VVNTNSVEAARSNLVIIRSEAAKQLLARKRMREHVAPFIKKVFTTVDPKTAYRHNWHIDYMAEYLEAVYLKQVINLILNVPPRFLKSICGTVGWPAWLLGKDSSDQILAASYADKLATKHSVDCRVVIESEWYRQVFPQVHLARDQNEKTKFQTTARGHRIATSVGGTATGEGGDKLILDDPMDPRRSLSEPERKATNEWVDQTWSTRKNDPQKSSEVIIMQRLHVDDSTGHILSQQAAAKRSAQFHEALEDRREAHWEHVVIPQEAERRTVITYPLSGKKKIRQKDELLHAARFDETARDQAKLRLGTYGYAGQHQQRPTPVGGGRVKTDWFPRYRVLPTSYDEVILSYDTAQKGREINNPSVGQVYVRRDAQWYLAHQWKDHVRYPALKRMVIAMADEWHPDAICIEDKSSGSSLIQELEEHTDLPVIPIEPESDKITRFDTQTPSLEAGVISLPDPMHVPTAWLAFLEECLSHFPAPPMWDELDAMSQFLKHIRKRERTDHLVPAIAPFSLTRQSPWRGGRV